MIKKNLCKDHICDHSVELYALEGCRELAPALRTEVDNTKPPFEILKCSKTNIAYTFEICVDKSSWDDPSANLIGCVYEEGVCDC